MPYLEIAVVVTVAAVWFLVARKPALYLRLLLAAAPWHGLYVSFIWNFDAFKLGLLLVPFVLMLRPPPHRGPLLRTLAVLLAYALALAGWQAVTGEVTAFDLLRHLDIKTRLAAANYLFLSRVLLVFLVVSVVRNHDTLGRCAHAYVGSAFVLSLYGLVQEASFLTTGNPITPMYSKGIFGDVQRFVTTEVFGVSFLRIHAFCMEPKDFALFMTPAIAFVSAALSLRHRSLGGKWIQWTQLAVMSAAALLTFSTSLLIVAPLILLSTEFVGRRFRWSGPLRRGALIACVLLIAWPVLQELWRVRVEQRLRSGETTLLQRSREAPALEFLQDQFPRSLAGYGVGTQAFYLPGYMPAEFREMVYSSEVAAGIDSFWFALLLDLGIPGVILFGLACLQGLARTARNDDWTWPYRAAFLATVVMCIPQQGDLRSGVIWLFLGLAYQANRLAKAAEFPRLAPVIVIPPASPAQAVAGRERTASRL